MLYSMNIIPHIDHKSEFYFYPRFVFGFQETGSQASQGDWGKKAAKASLLLNPDETNPS